MKSGVLWKEGQGLFKKPWAHRYFHLSVVDRKLSYYTIDTRTKKGEVNLAGVSACVIPAGDIVKKQFGDSANVHPFMITYPSEPRSIIARDSMFLVANSYEEALDWVTEINKASVSKGGEKMVDIQPQHEASAAVENENGLDGEAEKQTSHLVTQIIHLPFTYFNMLFTYIDETSNSYLVAYVMPLLFYLWAPSALQPILFVIFYYSSLYLYINAISKARNPLLE